MDILSRYEYISAIAVIIPYIALSIAPQFRSYPHIRGFAVGALSALCFFVYAVLAILIKMVFRYRLLDFLGFGICLNLPLLFLSRTDDGMKRIYGSYIGINSSLFMKLAVTLLYTETALFAVCAIVLVLLVTLMGWLFLHGFAQSKQFRAGILSIRRIWIPLAIHYLTLCIISLAEGKACISLITGGFCLAGTYAAYWINEDILATANDTAQIKGKNSELEQLLRIQESQYMALSGYMAEVRAARHDMRHHYSVIKKYIIDGDSEALLAYLETIEGGISYDYSMSICANPAVDAVARHYIGLAMAAGVSVDIALDIDEDIGIASSDLCIIIGNCLENAAEATFHVHDADRFIRIRSECSASMLTIVAGNSYAGERIEMNGVYKSTKSPDREGIGLSSIRAIAEKYDGYADFVADNGVFITRVILFAKDK